MVALIHIENKDMITSYPCINEHISCCNTLYMHTSCLRVLISVARLMSRGRTLLSVIVPWEVSWSCVVRSLALVRPCLLFLSFVPFFIADSLLLFYSYPCVCFLLLFHAFLSRMQTLCIESPFPIVYAKFSLY